MALTYEPLQQTPVKRPRCILLELRCSSFNIVCYVYSEIPWGAKQIGRDEAMQDMLDKDPESDLILGSEWYHHHIIGTISSAKPEPKPKPEQNR